MRRTAGELSRSGVAIRDLVPAGPLTVDGTPEAWADPEGGGGGSSSSSGRDSPSAKRHKKQQRSSAAAAVHRALLAARRNRARLAVVAATAAGAGLLLLALAWVAGAQLGGDALWLPGGPTIQQPLGRETGGWVPRGVALQAEEARQRGLAAAAAGGGGNGSLLVEFTAPGLFVPLSAALNLSLPEQPAEAALLAQAPVEAADAAGAAPHRLSLDEVLHRYSQLGAGFGSGSGAAGEKLPSSAADLANEIQAAVQQIEERARRVRKQQAEKQREAAEAAAHEGTAAVHHERAGGGSTHSTHSTHAAGSAGASDSLVEPGQLRLLVAVVSACCSRETAARRAAIRDTWGRVVTQHPNVDLRFFLSQPATPEAAAEWLPALQDELLAAGDLVVLRGADTYRQLPNKTLRTLRYMAASPAGYTHLLKIDDDCYLRLDRLLATLADPLDKAGTPQPRGDGGPPEGWGMAGSLAAAGPDPKAAAASAAGGAARGGVDAAPDGGGGALPATRKQLLVEMARRGTPLHTDGLQLYNVTELVARAGDNAELKMFDDESGHAVSLAEIAREAAKQHAAKRGLAAAGRPAPAGAAAAGGGSVYAAGQIEVVPAKLRMQGVYLGCLENKGGFFPIRDPASKWYLSYQELPDSAVPFAVKYLAGWGMVLSHDLAALAAGRANLYHARPDLAPSWFSHMPFEDVMLGLLLADATTPQDHQAFKAAWRACSSDTAVKHLDVDAPRLFRGLYEQDVSGLWKTKPVQCSTGDYLPGDYGGWKRWRDSLPSVSRI
ncbi:UDP-c:betaGal beta-1,3-N-acetylglucosaminyltransferase 6 isoform B [Micractinium conductrix]|uniref:UDP-GalNAc:beta-1,3-N-acetylgalactosaminyltransferase 2 n=1 Tax=Micractinium conductrix TaxID=554055 RepID=A0A2P6V5W6_9CHLO|nr:UDP-c:betaGal beta-1,3-N-acetylglucosaminyltransferase 6 isoform B [Micractinium conductrix]|eukprot:PSC69470.1 UDP-c:betaGal beta-1,3-N-acetylglucosaminyltransferase 6 isoform B [Micractinium conductrix]